VPSVFAAERTRLDVLRPVVPRRVVPVLRLAVLRPDVLRPDVLRPVVLRPVVLRPVVLRRVVPVLRLAVLRPDVLRRVVPPERPAVLRPLVERLLVLRLPVERAPVEREPVPVLRRVVPLLRLVVLRRVVPPLRDDVARRVPVERDAVLRLPVLRPDVDRRVVPPDERVLDPVDLLRAVAICSLLVGDVGGNADVCSMRVASADIQQKRHLSYFEMSSTRSPVCASDALRAMSAWATMPTSLPSSSTTGKRRTW
jgi:hypothetical protein